MKIIDRSAGYNRMQQHAFRRIEINHRRVSTDEFLRFRPVAKSSGVRNLLTLPVATELRATMENNRAKGINPFR